MLAGWGVVMLLSANVRNGGGSLMPRRRRRRRRFALAGVALALFVVLAGLAGWLLPEARPAAATGTLTVYSVEITSNPGPDQKYDTGDTILVEIFADHCISGHGNGSLAITIGDNVRPVSPSGRASSPTRQNPTSWHVQFSYTVVADDLDADGITVAPNALSGTWASSDSVSNCNSAVHTHGSPTLPNDLATPQANHRVNYFDYDADDDNLIDVTTLAQLAAMEHDRDGDGDPSAGGAAAYNAAFRGRVSGATGRMGCPGTCAGYELMADLDFSGSSEYANWSPINTFETTFQGNGHTISNLNINARNAGLFSTLGGSGVVTAVGLINPTVVSTRNGGFAAGLVGDNHGIISASYVRGGSVTSSGGDGGVGGLVGINRKMVRASYASGTTVSSTGTRDIVGGLVGSNINRNATIEYSYAASAVTATGANARAGCLTRNTAGAIRGTITASYYSSDVCSAGGDGSRTATQLQTPTDYSGPYTSWNRNLDGVAGNDDPWAFGTASQYPVLQYLLNDYDDDNDNLIDIRTLAQLNAIRHDLNGNGDATHAGYVAAFPHHQVLATGRMGCASACAGYELRADLDFNTDGSSDNSADAPYANWSPLGTYTSTFQGNGHTISNLASSGSQSLREQRGLFTNLGSGSTVTALGLINPRVSVSGFSSAVGALADKNDGTISAVFVRGGSVSAPGNNSFAGGLVGWNAGTIRAAYSTAAVSAAGSAGGLANSNAGGTIIASYAAGAVTGSGTTNCLTSADTNGTVTNSYWSTGVCTHTGGGGTAQTASALQTPTGYSGIYSGWNINVDTGAADDPWSFGSASQYPILQFNRDVIGIQWQRNPGATPLDYDDDDDNLIDVRSPAQLDAIRYDLNGDGLLPRGRESAGYAPAFPGLSIGMGCPDTCTGYELRQNLDFDTTGNDGIADAPFANWTPIDGWYSGILKGNNHTIANLTIDAPHQSNVGLFTSVSGNISGIGLPDASVRGANDGVRIGVIAGQLLAGGSVSSSWATGSVTSTSATAGTKYLGGLVGFSFASGPAVRASYAGVDVTAAPTATTVHAGGLAGRLQGTTLSASYATGNVAGGTSSASYVGGLVGSMHSSASITTSYARGRPSGGPGANIGGLAGNQPGRVTNSYWDTTASGRADTDQANSPGTGQKTYELRNPTAYGTTGSIYSAWNVNVDGNTGTGDADGNDDPWNFGTISQYPVLQYGGLDTGRQFRAQPFIANDDTLSVLLVTPATLATTFTPGTTAYTANLPAAPIDSVTVTYLSGASSTVAISAIAGTAAAVTTDADSAPGYQVNIAGPETYITITVSAPDGSATDYIVTIRVPVNNYDDDRDNLIDVKTLAQLNAIRYDLNGDGAADRTANAAAYRAAFPYPSGGNRCAGTCAGYELRADLDFDTNTVNDRTDDAYSNGGLGWLPIGDNSVQFTSTFEGNSADYAISNLYINRPSGNRVGLFGQTAGATLRNIALEDVNIRAEHRAGALVGHAGGGTIANSYSTGGSVTVTGDRAGGLAGQVNHPGTIADSYSTVNVAAQGGEAGGLTATLIGLNDNYASITSSYAAGTVSATTNAGGLVGRVAPGNITSSYATGAVSSASNNARVGGLVGWFQGSADGGGTSAVTTTSNLTASYATGAVSVTGNNARAGGLVGENLAYLTNDGRAANRANSNIRASYATGAVNGGTGASNRLGGLVGYNNSDRTPFTSTQGVEGVGVHGITTATINASYATGRVTGASAAAIGGLVGENRANHTVTGGTNAGESRTAITASYWDTTTTTVADDTDTNAPEGLLTTALQSPTAYGTTGIYSTWNLNLDGAAGNDDPWDFGTASQYPVLQYQQDVSGIQQQRPAASPMDYDDDDDNLIDVRSPAQLDAIRYDLNGDGAVAQGSASARYLAAFPGLSTGMGCPTGCAGYELRRNLDFDTTGDDNVADAPYDNWTPIGGTYSANFDGNNHTISNLTIDAAGTVNDVGLFATVSGNISGIGLPNASVTGAADTINIGALAGRLNTGGTVTASWSTGTVASTSSVNSSSRIKRAGGLLGTAQGAVRASYSAAAVSVNSGALRTYTGGLVGTLNQGRITASYATGAVAGGGSAGSFFSYVGGLVGQVTGAGSVITASYATGAVTAGADVLTIVGGLAGQVAAGAVTYSYWDTEASGITGTGAGLGKTTNELRTPTAYGTSTTTSIYAAWNVNVDGNTGTGDAGGNDDPWDFGAYDEYPVLQYDGMDTVMQVNLQPSVGALATLTVTGAALSAPFATANLTYTATLPDDPTGITVTVAATSTNPTAAVSYRAVAGTAAPVTADADADTADHQVILGGPSTVITITVTPQNGIAQSYTVTIAVPEHDYDTDDDNLIDVTTLAQLNAIRYDLNGDGAADNTAGAGALAYAAAYLYPSPGMGCAAACTGYELRNDLDFDDNDSGMVDSDDQYPNWTPIGGGANAYSGTFQGNNHVIDNLTINAGATVDDVGLFGRASGAISGVGLPNASIAAAGSGALDVGALAGQVDAAGSVTASWSTGRIAATDTGRGTKTLGGLVGVASGNIRASYSTATTTAATATTTVNVFAGGLAGYLSNADIIASYATGSVTGGGANFSFIGGLTSYVDGATSNVIASYATGTVTGGAGVNINGLFNFNSLDPPTTTASYWDTTTTGINDDADTTGPEGRSTSVLQSPTDYGTTGLYSGWNVNVDGAGGNDDPWNFGTNAQYPILQFGQDARGIQRQRTPNAAAVNYDANGNNLIDVATLARLDAIRYDLDGDGATATGPDAAQYAAAFPGLTPGMGCPTGCTGYELTANLDFDTDDNGMVDSSDTYPNWTPIGGTYTGNFDGNNHTIANLTINAAGSVSYVGLFGQISGDVSGVGLPDASITGAAATINAGVLAGQVSTGGAVTSSWATGSVTSTNTSTGSANKLIGGLVGYAAGPVQASYARVDVTAANTATSVAAGGLVGYLFGGTLTASYATGAVAGGAGGNSQVGGLVGVAQTGASVITASYATGTVTSDANSIGGLVGFLLSGATVVNSYWDTTTSGITGTGAGVGKTTAELQSPIAYGTSTTTSIYAGWNVDVDGVTGGDDPWDFGYAVQYPALKYDGLDVFRQGRDNIVLAPAVLNMEAGETATYTVRLGAAPTAAVTVNIGSNSASVTIDHDDGGFAIGETLNFSTTDWLTPRTITVRVASGATLGDATLAHSATGPGSRFDGFSANLPVGITIDYDRNDNNLIDITTLAQLNAIRHDPDGNGDATHADYIAAFPGRITTPTARMGCPGACAGYELRNDLDFDTDGIPGVGSGDEYPNWTPIATYASTFDGNGHTIANLNIAAGASVSTVGLFGTITGAISGIGLDNATVTSAGTTAAAGALVGTVQAAGTVTSSWSTGRVTSTDTGASVKYVGGLAGFVYGTVRASYSTAAVTASDSAISIGAGGLAGSLTGGNIIASYATGSVTGGTGNSSYVGGLVGSMGGTTPGITASYAIGTPSSGPNANVGGLAGNNPGSAVITNSYWDTDASRITGTGAGLGKTTNELRTPTAYGTSTTTDIYAAWNVDVDGDTSTGDADGNDDPWHFGYAVQYPVLQYDGLDLLTQARDTIVLVPAALDLEPGETASYSVRLGAAPTAPVAITLASDNPDVTINRATLNFTDSTYATEQNVTVSVDSGVTLGAAAALTHTAAAGTGSGFENTATTTLTVTVTADYDVNNNNLIDVTSLAQLDAIRYDLDGNGTVLAADAAAYTTAYPNRPADMGCPATCAGYELTADLDFDTDGTPGVGAGDEYPNWTPIGGTYAGDFDGNNRTIANLTINAAASVGYVGLFGQISGDVSGIGLPDASVSGAASNIYAGALAGRLNTGGTVTAAWSTGSVTSTSSVSGSGLTKRAGGLLGTAQGAVRASYSEAAVSTNSAAVWTYTGGLVGSLNLGQITASYATGPVSGGVGAASRVGGLAGRARGAPSTITASYATGTVTGGAGARTGGVVGELNIGAPAPVNSYWDSDTGGITGGQTTAALQSPTDYGTGIYADWNVDVGGTSANDDPWHFGYEVQYPALKYDGMDVFRQGRDNIVLVPAALDLEAGDTATYTVRLGAQPTAAVMVAIASDSADVTFDGPDAAAAFTGSETLDFSTTDWLTAQRITVQVDAAASLGAATLTHTVAGPGSRFEDTATTTLAVGITIDYDRDDNNLIDITTLAQLNAIRYDLNGDGTVLASDAAAYTMAFPGRAASMGCQTTCAGYELTADLDFDTNDNGMVDSSDTYPNWTPIGGTYTSTFDGNNHTIANLTIDAASSVTNVGLFATVGGDISGIGLPDASVTGAANIIRIGALAGRLDTGGTVTSSWATGSVTSTSTSTGLEIRIIGGLVGYALGPVRASYAGVDVTAANTAIAVRAGGLVGLLSSSALTASYATGAVAGGTSISSYAGGLVGLATNGASVITASYATGAVTAGTGANTGGLAGGLLFGATVVNSYWDTTTSGITGTGAGLGKTTAELQSPTAYGATGIYSDWNVDVGGTSADDDPWHFGYDSQYPVLQYDGLSPLQQERDTIVLTPAALDMEAGESASYSVRLGAQPTAAVTVDILSNNTSVTIDDDDSTFAIDESLSFSTTGWDDAQTITVRVDAAASLGAATLTHTATGPGSGFEDTATTTLAVGITVDYDRDDNNLIDVSNLAQLNAIRYDLNGNGDATHADYASAFPGRITTATGRMGCPGTCAGYELTADLDFDTNDDGTVDSNDPYANWSPIGGTYTGDFDGNNHTIANLTINAAASVTNVGLFATVSGDISGVGLPDVNVTGAAHGIRAGALAGYVTATGSVTSSWATGSVTSTSTTAAAKRVGGLVGYSLGNVRASYADVTVTASQAATAISVIIGGLAGHTIAASVTASYATGAVSGGYSSNSYAGGLVGLFAGSTSVITASYATGAVTAGASVNTGGLAGRLFSGATAVNSYWDTETTGITGGRTTSALQSPTGYTDIYSAWNVDVDGANGNDDPWDFGYAVQYPVLQYGGLDLLTQGRDTIVLVPDALSVNEGSSDTYTVRLGGAPKAGNTVTVTVASDNAAVTTSHPPLTFNAGNYNSPRTVTVSAPGDPNLADDTATLTHLAVAGTGSGFENTATTTLAVTTTDNDRGRILLTQNSVDIIALSVTEEASEVTYDVALDQAPLDNVTVTVTVPSDYTDAVQINKDSGTLGNTQTLTFTPTDYAAQTITVRALNDIDGIGERFNLSHTIAGTGHGYAGVSKDLPVTVIDINSANILLHPTTATTTLSTLPVDEEGTASYRVRLNTQPTAAVSVTVTAPSGLEINDGNGNYGSTRTLSFPATAWDTLQTVTVRALADDDLTHETGGTITHVAGSTDSAYQGLSRNLPVTIRDIDEASIILSATSTLALIEGGSPESYTVALSHRPAAPVTVTVTATAGVTVDKNTGNDFTITETLTFTSDNYGPQTIRARAASDTNLADETTAITHAITSAGDANYHALEDVSRPVTVTDTTAPTFLLTDSDSDPVTALTVHEQGSDITYGVALSHEPTGTVTVTVAATGLLIDGPDTGAVFSASETISFTTSNWQTAQMVTIQAPSHDANSQSETAMLAHSATGGGYAGVSSVTLTVTIDDNDDPEILLWHGTNNAAITTLPVTEENTTTYRVLLNTEPTAAVSVRIDAGNGLQINDGSGNYGSTRTLSFSTTNWTTAQAVTIRATADDDLAPDTSSLSHTASNAGPDDSAYAGVSKSLSVPIIDNDTPAIILSETALSVDEGGTGTYTVKLSNQPAAGVTITITSSTSDDVEIDGPDSGLNYSNEETLRFSTGNWNSPQTVTVRGLTDDDLATSTGNTLTHAASNTTATDSLFSTAADVDLDVTVTDTTTPTIVLTKNSAAITTLGLAEEGSQVTYQVALSNPPLARVSVLVSSSDADAAAIHDGGATYDDADFVSSRLLNFDAGTTTAQTITLWAPADGDDDNETVTLTHAASDATMGTASGYAGISKALTVTVTDDDTPDIKLSAPTLTVREEDDSEGGGGGSYTVRLGTQPASDVTVTITANDGLTIDGPDSGTDFTSSETLTFTNADYAAKTIYVRGLADDNLAHNDIRITHRAASDDRDFAGKTATLTVTVTDNDTGSILPSATTTIAVIEGDDTGTTYDVRLSHQPDAAVTVTIANDTGLATTTRPTLTFNAGNWNTPQTVTVKGLTDADRTIGSDTLTHTPSATGGYLSSETADVSVTILDTTAPVITLSTTTITLLENSSARYTVVLNDPPPADTTVAIASSNPGVTVSPDTLSFTAADYGALKTVTVTTTTDSDTVHNAFGITHTPTIRGVASPTTPLPLLFLEPVPPGGGATTTPIEFLSPPPGNPAIYVVDASTTHTITTNAGIPEGVTIRSAGGVGLASSTTITIGIVPDGSTPATHSGYTLDPDTLVDITVEPVPAIGLQVCLPLPQAGGSGGPRMLHYDGSRWRPVSGSRQIGSQVCGTATDFSPYIAARLAATTAGPPPPPDEEDDNGNGSTGGGTPSGGSGGGGGTTPAPRPTPTPAPKPTPAPTPTTTPAPQPTPTPAPAPTPMPTLAPTPTPAAPPTAMPPTQPPPVAAIVPQPAVIGDITFSNPNPQPGSALMVEFPVTNPGAVTAEYQLVLEIAGEVVQRQTLTVPAGVTQTVQLPIVAPSVRSEVTLRVDGQSQIAILTPAMAAPTPAAGGETVVTTPAVEPAGGGAPWLLIGIIAVIALAIIGGGIALLMRRRA